MKTEIVEPNVSNFIRSLRDVGYTFEIAVADILDNSITAGASLIEICALPSPKIRFEILDNGKGMCTDELVEAMRLASKNPLDERDQRDLGRFGLGLKTASFSQCLKVTVITKRNNTISSRQWDLDHIQRVNKWELITPSIEEQNKSYYFEKLQKFPSGTIVIWEKIDQQQQLTFTDTIDRLSKHLSLVFHRFLEGKMGIPTVRIRVNERILKPFNPFNVLHSATQQIPEERLKFYDTNIVVQPFILPHHSKLSQTEYEKFATSDGYTRSQGFYLYRANRLLVYGTWWGLHRAIDAHKLVRIQIDIPNNQDHLWGIDIKKSRAKPVPELRNDLKRIVRQVTNLGSRPYTGRGKKIEDKITTNFWNLVPLDDSLRFEINEQHPVYEMLRTNLSADNFETFRMYLKGLQAYIPLDAIQAQLQQEPHKVNQKESLSEDDIRKLAAEFRKNGLSDDEKRSLLNTDLFKGRSELFNNGNE